MWDGDGRISWISSLSIVLTNGPSTQIFKVVSPYSLVHEAPQGLERPCEYECEAGCEFSSTNKKEVELHEVKCPLIKQMRKMDATKGQKSGKCSISEV